jgi:hypothetical protein
MAVCAHSGSKPCQQAGAGEFLLGVSFGYRGIRERAKGGPIETVFSTQPLKPMIQNDLTWAAKNRARTLEGREKRSGINSEPTLEAGPV